MNVSQTWVRTPAANDSSADCALISQRGECKVVTALRSELLSGHFLPQLLAAGWVHSDFRNVATNAFSM